MYQDHATQTYVQEQTFLLEDLKMYVNKEKQFGEFGLFSEMPGLVPGRMSGCMQDVAHNTCLNTWLSLLKMEKHSRKITHFSFV